MKIVFKRLDHVQICIPNGEEATAREFYTNILGLTEIEKPVQLRANGGLWYQVGDVQLHIGVEAQANKSKRHPAFEILAIDEVRNYLHENGIRIQEEIQVPGLSRFSFFDPFSNRIELLEYKPVNG